MTDEELRSASDASIAFARANLKQLCAELVTWTDTGEIPGDGKLRELIALCRIYSNRNAIAVARSHCLDLATRFTADSHD